MKKLFIKTISIFLLMAVVVSNLPLGIIVAGVRPSVSISSPSKTSVEEGSSVKYTVNFSNADEINDLEDYVTLYNFDADITVTGTGSTRVITLSDVEGSAGKKAIAIKAGAAENDNGTSLATPKAVSFTLVEKTSNSVNNNTNNNTSVVVKDTTKPSISVSSPSVTSVNAGGTVKFVVTFSDNVGIDNVNLSKSYVNLNGFTADVTVTGSGNTRTITLSNVQGEVGNKNISIKAGAAEDAAGNATLATPNTVSFKLAETKVTVKDTTRPSISISEPSVTSVNVGGTVKFVVTFADNVGIDNVNLSKSYVNLNGFTADVAVTGSGNTRTITLSNVQGEAGNKNISIKAGAAEDAAGNATLATPNTVSFKLVAAAVKVSEDEVRPSISISEPSVKEVYAGGTVAYVITFADNRGIEKVNLSKEYLIFNGFTADVTVTGEGNTRTVTLSNIQGEVGKNYNIVVKAGAAEDAAGNKTIQTPHSVSFQIIKKAETVKPTTPSTGKLDNEPNTGIESLPVLPIMGSAALVLTVAGIVITKKIYG